MADSEAILEIVAISGDMLDKGIKTKLKLMWFALFFAFNVLLSRIHVCRVYILSSERKENSHSFNSNWLNLSRILRSTDVTKACKINA